MRKIIKKTGLALCLSLCISTAAMAHSHNHEGVVKETMSSGGYTYMLVANDGGETWVAIPKTDIKVGDQVKYIHGIEMEKFASKSLNRIFDSIIFSEGLDVGQGTQQTQMPTGHGDMFAAALKDEDAAGTGELGESVGSSGAVSPFTDEKVEKASGDNAYTVGELFEKRKDLEGQQVRVQAKVVKVTPQIMGKNWIHLQDGSGNPMHNSHDLVVTSVEDTPQVGDIVTMEGVVTVDRDFGYSYKYDLLIEEGKSL